MNLASLDLNLLLVLAALLDEGSVRAAARRLSLSPPATSHALARLRHTLRDPLFVRSRGAMVPTQRALELRADVERAVESLERVFVPATAFDPRRAERTFRLAMTDVLEAAVLPRLQRRLAARAPSVRIVVEPRTHPERLDALARGQLDLLVALAGFEPPAAVREVELFRDRFVCVVRKGGPARLSKAAYARARHVQVAPHGQKGSVADEAMAAHGVRRDIAFVVPHFAVAMLLVAGSDLVTTVPSSVIGLWPADVRAVPCPIPLPALRFCAYAHRRAERDGGVAWLLGELREVGKALDP